MPRLEPESSASANSAISAFVLPKFHTAEATEGEAERFNHR
nr:MAG TPA: hypothetical protein [Caudoviricetes sp.]